MSLVFYLFFFIKKVTLFYIGHLPMARSTLLIITLFLLILLDLDQIRARYKITIEIKCNYVISFLYNFLFIFLTFNFNFLHFLIFFYLIVEIKVILLDLLMLLDLFFNAIASSAIHSMTQSIKYQDDSGWRGMDKDHQHSFVWFFFSFSVFVCCFYNPF